MLILVSSRLWSLPVLFFVSFECICFVIGVGNTKFSVLKTLRCKLFALFASKTVSSAYSILFCSFPLNLMSPIVFSDASQNMHSDFRSKRGGHKSQVCRFCLINILTTSPPCSEIMRKSGLWAWLFLEFRLYFDE